MKHPRPQTLEIQFDTPEAFQLIVQTTLDGHRLAQETAQRAADRAESETLQTDFLSPSAGG